MLFICYPKCSTCKKAQKWLDENGFEYTTRDIKQENPSQIELETWYSNSELPLRRFFNTSGLKYRELGLSKTLDSMEKHEQLALLATDGMLVKRPLLIKDNITLVGFNEGEWERNLK